MKWIRRLFVLLLLLLVIAGAVGAFLYNDTVNGPLPQHAGTLTVTGLNAPVEVIRDAWGVPHIYAENSYDLFFAQGYTHAQDRWWQMEFYRATGDGRLQELTGQNDALMGSDIFIRSVGWRRAAERDLAEVYDDDTIALMQAFADGVNAYITNRPADDLALEYRLLGLTGVNIDIRPWTTADTVVWQKVMAWDLGGGGVDRLRAELVEAVGETMFNDFFPAFDYDAKPTILSAEELPLGPESLGVPVADADNANTDESDDDSDTDDTDEAEGDAAVLDSLLARAGLTGDDVAFAGGVMPGTTFVFGQGEGIGSNSWVVSGDLTETGMPLFANDPHLGIQLPSIWYEIGLHCQPVSDECPYDVRGFALTPFPGIVIGHNAHLGWGFTNVGWDVMDFYRIEVNPENPLQYRYNDEWVDMTVHEEEIRFGNGLPPVTIQVRETHFGPILNDNLPDDDGQLSGFNNEDPLAIRWTGIVPQDTMRALFGMNRATTWTEFRAAAAIFAGPAQNLVYADVEGNIGYQTPGLFPVRPASNDGILPLDGTTDAHEWLGFVPSDLLPRALNPERGYIHSANQPVVPLAYYPDLEAAMEAEYGQPVNVSFGTVWAEGYRGERIVALLEAGAPHSIDSFQRILMDDKVMPAVELMPYFAALEIEDAVLAEVRDWLLTWENEDYRMSMDSRHAPLFATVHAALLNQLFDDEFADISYSADTFSSIIRLAADPENAWWDDVRTQDITETRDDILLRALDNGYAAAVDLLGADRDAWRWGDIHTADFISNPLGQSGIDLIEQQVNCTGYATSGGTTVNRTGYDAGDEDYTVGNLSSLRMILDFSDLDNNLSIHTTGQSGHPFSADYCNMIDPWRLGQFKPMPFNRAAVESVATATLRLEP